MLFLLKTPKWYDIRRKMAPTSKSGKLKLLSEITLQSGAKMVEYVDREIVRNNVMDVRELCAKFTVNSITASTLGVDIDCFENDNSPLRVISKKIFNWKRFWYSFETTCYLIAPKLVKLFNIQFLDTETSNHFRSIFWESLSKRRMSNEVQNDLMDILLKIGEQDHIHDAESLGLLTSFTWLLENLFTEGSKTFNHPRQVADVCVKHFCKTTLLLDRGADMLVGQFAQFFLAGFETTSSTMSFVLIELALNPDIQTRLRKEIMRVEKLHGSFSYDSLNEMEYLQNTIFETLRKYPVLPYLDRRCTKTYTIPGTDVTILKGQMIYISIMGIQHDEKYYPNPEKFDPERFAKKHLKSRQKLSFLAFGDGPRFCLGKRLGLLNVKIGLAYLLSNFEVKVCHQTDEKVKLISRGTFLQPVNGIYLEIIKLAQK